MNSILIYLLESNICLIIFYGVYYFLLRNETWFQLNRIILLISVTTALLIPFIHYNIDIDVLINIANESEIITQEILTPTIGIEEKTSSIFENSLKLITPIYLSGILISLFVFIKRLNSLRKLLKKGKQEKKNGITYIISNDIDLIFSFFSFIFINQKVNSFSPEEYRRIIDHEMAHIEGKHSLDIIFIELLKIPFWFNPIIYAYKESFLQLHEYIADQKVIEKDNNTLDYATFLVNQARKNTRVYSFCNHLFHEPIKNRLIMMNKFKSKKRNAIRMLSMFPALLGMIFYFGIEYREVPVNMAEETKTDIVLDTDPVSNEERDTTPQPPTESKSSVSNLTPELGKCYAKCIMPNEYAQVQKTFAVFTGNSSDNVAVEELEIISSSAKQEWVKKKIEGACLSANPEDCKVWCLVETPAVSKKILVVKDINSTDKYEMKTFTTNELKKEGESEWQEIVCQGSVTTELIENIQRKLGAMGYTIKLTSVLDEQTKEALSQYQKDNELPRGNLNIATLKKLGL